MSEGNIDILQEMEPAQIFAMIGDNNVLNVISRLKFISKIKRGEKINVRELFVRDNDSILQRVLRSFKNYTTYLSSSDIVESKDATLNFIRDTVNDAINLISLYRHSKDSFQHQIATIISNNLEQAKYGIRNSIFTYKDDRKFISNAEAVTLTIEARLQSLKDHGYLPGFTESPLMPTIVMDELDEEQQ